MMLKNTLATEQYPFTAFRGIAPVTGSSDAFAPTAG
jgi:hypothetical protein